MNSASMVDWLTHFCRVEDQEMGAPAANKRYPVRSLVFPTARPVVSEKPRRSSESPAAEKTSCREDSGGRA